MLANTSCTFHLFIQYLLELFAPCCVLQHESRYPDACSVK